MTIKTLIAAAVLATCLSIWGCGSKETADEPAPANPTAGAQASQPATPGASNPNAPPPVNDATSTGVQNVHPTEAGPP